MSNLYIYLSSFIITLKEANLINGLLKRYNDHFLNIFVLSNKLTEIEKDLFKLNLKTLKINFIQLCSKNIIKVIKEEDFLFVSFTNFKEIFKSYKVINKVKIDSLNKKQSYYLVKKINEQKVEVVDSFNGDFNNYPISSFENKFFYLNKDSIDYIADNELFYISKVKEVLKEKRYLHSKSVANLCYMIALKNKDKLSDKNLNKYYFAGLFHDLGKYLSKEEETNVMINLYNNFINLPSYSYHQFTGSYMCKKLFSLFDDSINEAIEAHCTGKANMSDLAKILYAADKIDPLRGYNSKPLIEAMMNDFENGFIFVLKENMKYLKSVGDNPYSNYLTLECTKFYNIANN